MKTIKKVVITIIVLAIISAIAVFGIKYYRQHRFDDVTVDGTLVRDINVASWMSSGSTSYGTGIISSDNRQVIYSDDGKTVKEINVQLGDEVKKGDVLLTYDTARTDLELEIKKIELQKTENEIVLAQRELNHLKGITPVPDNYVEPEKPVNPKKKKDSKTKEMFDLPEKEGDAYNYIKEGAVPYDGDGSAENPFLFLCTEEVSYVYGSYLNSLIENGLVARFNIYEGNDISRDELKTTWKFDGNVEEQVSDEEFYSVETRQPVVVQEEVIEDDTEDDSSSNTDDSSTTEMYTVTELKEAIEEKETEIKSLDLTKRRQELAIKKFVKDMDSAEVVASVDGTVTKVGDANAYYDELDPGILLEVSVATGRFLSGSISELELDSIHIGDVIYATSWNNNEVYEAEVTEVLDYPTEDGNYYSYGSNSNVSYYPFKAFIADATGLNSGDALDLSISTSNSSKKSGIIIEKSYVRKESGKSYVYVCGEDDKLVKRYVETGKSYDGYYIEVLSGLKQSDFIVFPYGTNVREGITCVHEEYSEEFYNDMDDDADSNETVDEEIE